MRFDGVTAGDVTRAVDIFVVAGAFGKHKRRLSTGSLLAACVLSSRDI